MDGKQLLGKMELIDPEFIEAADMKPKKKPIKWQYWSGLAACLTVAVVSAVYMAVDPGESSAVTVSPGDTASLFSAGGVMLILLAASILIGTAIAALMIKDKQK